MKAKEVIKLLKICRSTLHNYTKSGIIKGTLLDNVYYDYDEKSVFKMIKKDSRINVIYGKVSTYKQKMILKDKLIVLKFIVKIII